MTAAASASVHLSVLASKARTGKLQPEYITVLDGLLGDGWYLASREKKWLRNYELLSRFVERTGHARPTWRHVEDSVELGKWVVRCRGEHRTGSLSVERARMLEALPGWSWTAFADTWESKLAVLVKYVKREGHCTVPDSWVEDDVPLGRWVGSLRRSYGAGVLAAQRIEALEALPGWLWSVHDKSWADAIQKMNAFYAREGHARVGKRHIEDGFKLGLWLDRNKKARRAGTLPDDRARELDRFPQWHLTKSERRWEDGYSALLRYAGIHGTVNMSSREMLDEFAIGRFVMRTRQQYVAGELSAEQVAALEELPGWNSTPHTSRT